MKIVFFGMGSIGRRHAQILLAQAKHELFAFRSGQGSDNALDMAVKEIRTWQELDALQAEIAFITNPTALHIPIALECARRNMAIFMEKPIGDKAVDVDALVHEIQQRKLASYVAYCLRFSPVILKVKELIDAGLFLHLEAEAASYLPLWRSGRDHLKSYSAHARLGGGVIFDLSHEIDYVHFLLGGIYSIKGQAGRRGHVTVDAEDYADIELETGKGPAHVHLSFFSQMNRRWIKVDLEQGTVYADLLNGSVQLFKGKTLAESWQFQLGPNELLEKQMAYFLANLRNPTMMNNIPEAAPLFKKISIFRDGAYEQ